jgi:hypothetical protein
MAQPSPSNVLIRIARVGDDVYAERVPGFWVLVETYANFQEANVGTKIFLIQHALAHNPDFEWAVKPDQLIG